MDLAAILTALAAKVVAIAGVVGSSAYHPDTIPDTPYFTFGMPKGRLLSGSWEMGEFTLPMRCYYGRISDDPTTAAFLLPFVQMVFSAFRSGVTLGGLVTEMHIATWNADSYRTVGDETYHCIDFDLVVTVFASASYTA
jgi:hypothetical protein